MNVRFGSKAVIAAGQVHVRLMPEADIAKCAGLSEDQLFPSAKRRISGEPTTRGILSLRTLAQAAPRSLNEPWGEMMSKHERLSN